MNLRRALPGLVEAACLLGLAGFLAYLILGGNYWMYLNPKFKSLSWAAAAVLGALGVYSLLRPPARATWFRASLYVFVLALCLVSELGIQKWASVSGIDSAAAEQEAPQLPSRVTQGGIEYVRINLGELYDIAANAKPDKLGLNYAVRGFVRRSPEMDAKGEFVLYRVALYCCYADSTAVGFRVRPPLGVSLPENGTWLVAYAGLTPSKASENEPPTAMEGQAFSSVQPDFRLDARCLEPEKAPGMGMMYEWRAEEPYAY
jgi:uncharacterized repeat protein (TIGR03943 family)